MKDKLSNITLFTLVVMAAILGFFTLCVNDCERILPLLLLFSANFALWFLIGMHFEAFRRFLKGIILGFWLGIGKVFRKLMQKCRRVKEIDDFEEIEPDTKEKREENWAYCYHIALNEQIDEVIEYCDRRKLSLPATA